MAEKVKVRQDCIYASNPFHECSEYCLRKTAESKMRKDKKNPGSFGFDISKSFGRKKKGSLPKPPPISGFVSSEAQSSPTSHVSPKKKIESWNDGEFTSSVKPYPEENGSIHDLYSSDDQFESLEFVLPSESVIMPAYQKESRKTNGPTSDDKKDGENVEKLPHAAQIPFADSIGESPTISAIGSSFSFSGITHTLEDEDEEEVESITSESCVSVGKYRVKASFSSILQLVFDKYGDLAATCKLESIAMRSYYLECVCYIVQELQCTPFEQLSKSRIKELTAILKDVESSKINVSWLRAIFNKTAEAFELSNQHRSIEGAKMDCDRDVESLQKDLDSQMEDLRIKEKEVSNAKARVEETRARLNQLKLKSSQLDELIVSIQSKTDGFRSKSMLSKLL